MRTLLIIFVISTLNSWAIDTKPQLLRGCVNYDDSTITLSWKPLVDNCGSFKNLKIYSNEDGGAYSLITTINDNLVVEYPHYIANLNVNRKYYAVVSNTCNGVDSLVSDTISPDLLYPENIGLDSLSYDLTTQNIIAGWTQNPSKDTRGYQLYNFSSGNGDSIGFTTNTNYVISVKPATRFPVVIATLDSCNLSSILSTPHQVMYLTGIIDTCSRTINLNWSKYVGWNTVDSQSLYRRTNNGDYVKIANLDGSTTSFMLTGINLGDTLSYYIRAYNNKGVSSSSNQITFVTRKLETPSVFYLSNVSVTPNDEISVETYIDNTKDQKEVVIYKAQSAERLEHKTSIAISPSEYEYLYVDSDVDVNQHHYTYILKLINKCYDTVSISNSSTSILLSIDSNLSFNHYRSWVGEVEHYDINYKKDGFTWNTINTTTDSFDSEARTPGCYQIAAIEINNPHGKNKISYSNKACTEDSMRAFVPSAVNLNSTNNTFKVYGIGIDHTKSTYAIYNRWGEQLISLPTDSTWNCEYKGSPISPGVYIYIIYLKGLRGEQQTAKGTLYVIK